MGRHHINSLRGKFPHATYWSGPVVYVAEFDNGIVKVGMTKSVRARLSLVQCEARRHFGETSITRVHVTGRFPTCSSARAAEYRALADARRAGVHAHHRAREYFYGLAFESVVEMVKNSEKAA